jgi:hypothetical protein
MSLDDWRLGCALMNPNVVQDLDETCANVVAYVRCSLAALRPPLVPSRIDPPTEKEMERFVLIINNMSRETVGPVKVTPEAHASTIPIMIEESGVHHITRPIKKNG